MLDQTQRQAILTLHDRGLGKRAIARALGISRNTVRDVLADGRAEPPPLERAEQLEPVRDEILALYASCKGNLVRVHEELLARHGVSLSYPALTAFCRKHGIGHAPPMPKGSYDDVLTPGLEMQHDTSPHDVHIGGALRRVQTAALVLAYSRRLFFQFYPRFSRFECKVFLDEGVAYHDGACQRCMIDNTHVVVLHGTGRHMVPVPEMEAFGRRLGFEFIAHAVGDPDRKARVEGPFWFIEHNFLAGRQFVDFADANRAARDWCDKVNAKFRRSLSASSNELYAVERPKMRRLPAWRPEIYQLHQRVVDLDGYIHVDGHTYSVPYQLLGKPVEVRESKDTIRVFRGPREVAVHDKIVSTIRGQRRTNPAHRPPRGHGAAPAQVLPEERELAAAGPPFADYAAALKQRGGLRWPAALRRLAQLHRDYPAAQLAAAIQTAAHYGLYDLDRLERMILKQVATDFFVLPVERDGPAAADHDSREGGDEG
ncbi:MAG TPA: helix-turn-helix domain-containing protein [Gemmatimonadaceae bacterium]|nr:helix-turn-helix domain-containing protein [Gemmatimonadaceae bacterium]